MSIIYEGVPELGEVGITNHALERMKKHNITQKRFEFVLYNPIRPDMRDGLNVVFRERDGLRIVIILRPEPYLGIKLVTTVYPVGGRLKARSIARRKRL